MSFNGPTTVDETRQFVNAILLFNSSSQAIMEASIDPVASSWYDTLNGLLGDAESLIIEWRQGGWLYYYDDSLQNIVSCGDAYLQNKKTVEALFDALQADITPANRKALVDALDKLKPPAQTLISSMNDYQQALGTFGGKVQSVIDKMKHTVAEIQAQENKIKDQIASINQKIKNLQSQIKTDREAIAKAKSARKKGIIETVFGVVFAPFTGGLTLILAGIGVSTIAQADDKIDQMQKNIASYQQDIAQDQSDLTKDQREISTLHGLVISTEMVIDDMNFIIQSLDPLRDSFTELSKELEQTLSKIDKAEQASEVIVAKAWYDAVCDELQAVVSEAKSMSNRPIDSHKVRIG